MSLVGTRPILQDELLKYELHHRARIAIKPGITGMWQVSGRSDITDFEEVVRLDTEYISNWNFGLVMYKKSAVLKSGNYQSVLLYEDYDLFARMVLEYHIKSYNIPEPLYYIRTSEDFFKRRGGIKYAKTVLKFKWGQYRKGYMSLMDFCISGLGQAFVCVLPNSLRKIFYMKFLRK